MSQADRAASQLFRRPTRERFATRGLRRSAGRRAGARTSCPSRFARRSVTAIGPEHRGPAEALRRILYRLPALAFGASSQRGTPADRRIAPRAGEITRSIGVVACDRCWRSLVFSAGASAKRGLVTGFADGEEFQSGDASQRDSLVRTGHRDADAGIVRLAVDLARDRRGPTRPADPTNPGSSLLRLLLGRRRCARRRGPRPQGAAHASTTPRIGPRARRGPADAAAVQLEADSLRRRRLRPGARRPLLGQLRSRWRRAQPPLPAAQADEVWNEANSTDWLTPQFEGKTVVGVDLLPGDAERLLQVHQVGQPEDAGRRRRYRPVRRSTRRPVPGAAARPAGPVLAAAPLRASPKVRRRRGKKGKQEIRQDKGLHRAVDVRRPLPSSDRQHRRRPAALRPHPVRRLHSRSRPDRAASSGAPRRPSTVSPAASTRSG